tara:strand:- start:796 stop:1653 length:858 start_codon:yes stop_codon:yes gene_type:complete
MDRTLVAEDTIMGEDTLSKFNSQHLIEMYMEDASGGFAGERELMTQFGLQNLSEATFVVAKDRFQTMDSQMRLEDGTDTTGGSILQESGTSDSTEKLDGSSFYIIQDTANTDSDRPQEGDAVYHPVLKKLFEVNFVDHDEPFHQLDNNPVYKLRCRLFEYSSEALDTGIAEIDAIEDALSVNTMNHQITLEQSSAVNENFRLERFTDGELIIDETDGDKVIGEDDSTSVGEALQLENGSYIVQEDYIVGDMSTDKTAQNELFDEQDDTILDFTESNPFGDVGTKG